MVKIGLILSLIISGYLTIVPSSNLSAQEMVVMNDNPAIARVKGVEVSGKANNYTFAVTISSPDTGCDRYADWWEVISPAGELIYRRVLLHSHVDEQPFRRTGGTVTIQPEQEVIIRVHMSPDGYSPLGQRGTVQAGFRDIHLDAGFATNLESIEPLPKNCAF